MKELLTLLKPRYWAFRKGLSGRGTGRKPLKLFFMGAIGLAFWSGAFAIFHSILYYFQGVEGFGDILAYKLLSMVLLTFFALLIFSGVVTSLAKYYLSRDLILVHSLPMPQAGIFFARFLESTLDSSWMVIVYSLPVFLSYGIVYNAGWFFYFTVATAILPLCLIASALSSLCVILVALVLPAGRIRSVLIFLGLILFLVLLVAFRLMRPEQLVDPDAFISVLVYFKSLSTPASPFIPTTWIYDALRASLQGKMAEALFHLILAWSFAIAAIFIALWAADAFYFKGFSKSQTAPEKLFPAFNRRKDGRSPFFVKLLPGPVASFAVKEVKTFFRDQTQWPQLLLLLGLIVIYVYNFSVLPLERSPIPTVYLQNVISFLNMGLAAFVLTAVAARFVFPAVSLEGEAFWIIQAAPISMSAFVWIKFFVYYTPLLIFSEMLIVTTNLLLHVTPFMMWLSTVTVFFLVPGIVSLGMGLGAAYPDFKSENPAQSVTSFGGIIFMLISALFIGLVILLEAGPVYTLFMAGVRGKSISFIQWVWVLGSFAVIILLCILTVIIPMRMGIAALMEK